MITSTNFDIDFIINKTPIPLEESETAFSIKESIYEVFPRGIITLKEPTGLLNESLVFTRGSEISLNIGKINNQKNNCNYFILKSNMHEPYTYGHYAGDIELLIMHSLNKNLVSKNNAYKGRISELIRNICSLYSFEEVIINDTSNDDTWYQLQQNDFQFIVDQLLPNAYSRNSNNSPYFFYIGTDNKVRFLNLQSMYDKVSLHTYDFKQKTFDNNIIQNNEILSVKTISKDYFNFYKNINRSIEFIDRQTGNKKIINDSIVNHLNLQGNKLNIKNEIQGYTKLQSLGFTENETNRNENILGQINFHNRESLFIDELYIVTPLNPLIHAGDKITVNLHYDKSKALLEKSNIYSGDYLIEEIEYIYDTKENKHYNSMKVGRTYINLTNDNRQYVLNKGLLA